MLNEFIQPHQPQVERFFLVEVNVFVMKKLFFVNLKYTNNYFRFVKTLFQSL
jgi:hypothetical protein